MLFRSDSGERSWQPRYADSDYADRPYPERRFEERAYDPEPDGRWDGPYGEEPAAYGNGRSDRFAESRPDEPLPVRRSRPPRLPQDDPWDGA